MRRFSDKNSLSTLTEINITPLLDLAFVLLIIFIITTPLMENSMNIKVPTSSTANQSVNSAQVISIDKDSVMKLSDEVVDAATLEQRLSALHDQKPDLAIVVRTDKDLSVQKLIGVMDILQRVKITNVGVVTQQP
jgi:biopolymer transport protein ExbD